MKTFHPIRSRDRYTNWHPANEAANLIVHISHIWEDLKWLKRIWKEIINMRRNYYLDIALLK